MAPHTRAGSALGAFTLAVCTALLCACSGGAGATSAQARADRPSSVGSVVSRLGRVPIPAPPSVQPTPVALRQHPQLLAMGQPVRIELPGVAAAVTTFGPVELTPYRGGVTLPTSTVGIVRVTVTPTRGRVTLRAADFLSRDEVGTVVALSAAGPAVLTATAAHPATLRIKGTFSSGAAQVTWRYQGRVIVIWDFNVELD